MPSRLDYGHLTSLFENATEGIILTDGRGNIILVNPAAEKIFQYSNSELEGKPIELLVPDESRPQHHQLRAGFYAHPSNRSMGQNRDLYGKRKDGTGIPVEVSLSHYNRNNEIFVIAFIVDITGRKQIENNVKRQKAELEHITGELRKLNADLESKVEERTVILQEALQKLEQSQAELNDAFNKEHELNEIKSRFVSMASHEFRTPLSTVLSSATLLSKYTKEDEQDKRDRHISRIKSSVKNLNDILEEFLSLGQLDAGKVQMQLTEISLDECISDILDEIRPSLKKGQFIEQSCEGTMRMYTDKMLLRNIIINLAGNAIKFSEEDRKISIHVVAGPDLASIEIKDEGIGISEADQANLFTSFFRGTNATNIQGTGLGLHIVQRYARLLGGSVTLTSRLQEGTTVIISIPTNQRG